MQTKKKGRNILERTKYGRVRKWSQTLHTKTPDSTLEKDNHNNLK